jgi:hypothetical protein
MQTEYCPECGADWRDEITCQDHFHQMLYWENEYPGHGTVHHLMVVCYHLQHPSLLSPEWLEWGKEMLAGFVERYLSPETVHRRDRMKLDSSKRTWKLKATPERKGCYERPVRWTMTAQGVVVSGAGEYINSVRTWAGSILGDLRVSKNF